MPLRLPAFPSSGKVANSAVSSGLPPRPAGRRRPPPPSVLRSCVAGLLAIISAWYVPGGAAAEQVIEHPGSLELVYIGYQQDNPPQLLVKAHTKYFLVDKGVTIPSINSIYFLEYIRINEGESVLDIGTGVGIQAIFAADKASRVVATDISPKAVDNARRNVRRYQLEDKVEVRQGDLFGAVRPDEKFDVVLMNIDYPYNDQTQHLWKVHERFFREVTHYLKPRGRIYYQIGLLDNLPVIRRFARENGLLIMELHMARAMKKNRELMVYRLERLPETRNGPALKQ